MNKKVYTSALILIIVFLLAQYVLKIFFPAEFIMYIENPRIVEVGVFIDSHWWLYLPCAFLIAFVSDYLFFGAVCRKVKLPKKLLLIMFAYDLVLSLLYTFAPMTLAMHSNLVVCCSMAYMFIVPLFFTDELKPIAITYAITNVAQLLTLAIRDLSAVVVSTNILTITLLSLESYLWGALCFVIFNYNEKKERDYGTSETLVRKRKVLGKEKSKSREACK